MSGSRQERRQLDRSLKLLGKAPLVISEVSGFNRDLDAVAADLQLATGRCAACQATSSERSLKSCHACAFVRYCNRECQTAGWSSHKLVCKMLAADCEIVKAPRLAPSASLLPLDAIWERLRNGGPVEAFGANVHLFAWFCRCGFIMGPAPSLGPPPLLSTFLKDGILAAGGIELLIFGLAAGGLRASWSAKLLVHLAHRFPETAKVIVAAGALPLLINLLTLPSKHADAGKLCSALIAADDGACLTGTLGPSVVDKGAIPALVDFFDFVTQGRSRLPAAMPFRDMAGISQRAARAMYDLFARGKADSEFILSTARSFIASGAVPLLAKMLNSDDIQSTAAAAISLAPIVYNVQHAASADVLGRDPYISKIVSVLQHADSMQHYAYDCVRLLFTILRLAPQHHDAALAAGALPVLLGLLLKRGSDSPSELRDLHIVTLALGALVEDNASACEQAVAGGALERMAALLKHPQWYMRMNAVPALTNLLFSAKQAQRDRVLSCGIVRLLAERLSETLSLVEVAAGSSLRHSEPAAALALCSDVGAPASRENMGNAPFLVSVTLQDFFALEKRGEEDQRYYASVADQVLEGISLSVLVKLIEKDYHADASLFVLQSLAISLAHRGALVKAGLPRALIALLTLSVEEGASFLDAFGNPVLSKTELAPHLLRKLVRGPEAAAAIAAVSASGGLEVLEIVGRKGGTAGSLAADCLRYLRAASQTPTGSTR